MVTPVNPLATTVTTNVVDLPVHAGQVLEGKFRVERIIGEGAMGLVVEATHLALDERVALKFLRREAKERPDIVTRFAREARAAAKIKSDHVAKVFDVGGTEDGTPFIVMEFLEGYDLEQILLTHGYCEIIDAAEHVIQACEGLTVAHVRGIVHRDIKPANLFIASQSGGRQVKILDFGISKAGITFEEVDVSSANTTQIMGSPHYMSPEQIRSTKDVDARADIWSLGVVLYELLTGQTPFTATEVTSIIAQVLYEPHRPVRSVRPELPIDLERIVDKCLNKDLNLRYQTAAELAVALLPFAPKSSRAVAEKASAIVRTAGGPSSGSLEESPESLPPPRRPRSSPSRSSGAVSGQTGPTGPTGPSGTLMLGPAAANAALAAAAHDKTSSPSMAVVTVPSHSPSSLGQRRQTNAATIYVALAAVIIGLAGGIFAIVARLSPSPPAAGTTPPPIVSVATATATATATAAATPDPTPTTSATTAPTAEESATQPVQSAPTTVQTAPTVPSTPVIAATQRRVVVPPSRPTASEGSPPAKSAAPESDIRHER